MSSRRYRSLPRSKGLRPLVSGAPQVAEHMRTGYPFSGVAFLTKPGAEPDDPGGTPYRIGDPVSCVEQGRWREVSAVFCASPRGHFAADRAVMVASVDERLVGRQARWPSRISRRSGTRSPRTPPDFHLPESFGALRIGLNASPSLPAARCLLRAVRAKGRGRDPWGPLPSAPLDSAVSFLKHVAAAEVREFPAVVLGETLRLPAAGIVGVGLRVEETLVHLAAFRSNRDGYRNPSRIGMGMRRASQRFRDRS
jgi:hypothetical protein